MTRVRQLDALRGFALIGIVLGNVQWFSGYAVDPSPVKDVLGLDSVVTFALHLLVEGKFYALFSLLFGASFALMVEGARRAGRDASMVARHRLGALLIVGSLHACTVWFGDIVSLYAVAAVPLYTLLQRSDRAVLRWSLGLLAAPAALSLVMLWLEDPTSAAAFSHGPAERLPAFDSGGYVDVLEANAAFLGQRWVLALTSGRLPRLLGLFLLGAWLIRRRGTRVRPRVLVCLWVIASVSNTVLAMLAHVPPTPTSRLGVLRDVVACVALPAGALTYASWLWRALGRRGRVPDALAHAGRLSLTHYLTQSLVLAAVFYGLGLGLWGTLGATTGALVGGALAVGQVAISAAMRRGLGLGPAERLLRALCRPRSHR